MSQQKETSESKPRVDIESVHLVDNSHIDQLTVSSKLTRTSRSVRIDISPPTTGTLVSPHDPLSSERQPVTNATLTIRCIKSFEYRTEKNLVLKGLDLTKLTARQLIEMCKQGKCMIVLLPERHC